MLFTKAIDADDYDKLRKALSKSAEQVGDVELVLVGQRGKEIGLERGEVDDRVDALEGGLEVGVAKITVNTGA